MSTIKKWIHRLFIGFARKSYSQEGEDLVLMRIFGHKKNGFYVDVGAHHPKRFSNTYLLYKLGWRGINLDAMPGSMKAFQSTRPRDINLEIPVSNKSEELTYYMFNEPALNGFSKEISEQRDQEATHYKIIGSKKLQTQTLEQVLDKYLPENTTIDFLSIDVEGLDFEVLQSNNWEKYKPTGVLVETLKSSVEDVLSSPLYTYLREKGYKLHSKLFNTCIFIASESNV